MNEQLSKILNNRWTPATAIGVLAFSAGVGIGYILGRKNPVSEDFDLPTELMEHFGPEELRELADASELLEEEEEEDVTTVVVYSEPEILIEQGMNFVEQKLNESVQRVNDLEPEPEEEELFRHNVFAESDDDWDYEIELTKRSETQPYVIHKDEFFADEKGYSQHTLTYYEGDDIMADEDDTPVYNHITVVGELKFGHGSGGDPKLFYVRNDKLRAEYEIIHDSDMFSRIVMGLEIENNQRVRDIKHSAGPLKFRMD